MRRTSFVGQEAYDKAPTARHRPAVWENMLGTVYGLSDDGIVKYFDYDYEAALRYSGGSDPGRDQRVWRCAEERGWIRGGDATNPRKGQVVLWVLKRRFIAALAEDTQAIAA